MKLLKLSLNAVLLILLAAAAWASYNGYDARSGTNCEQRGGEPHGFGACLERADPDPRAAEILQEIEEEEQRRRAFGDYSGPNGNEPEQETP